MKKTVKILPVVFLLLIVICFAAGCRSGDNSEETTNASENEKVFKAYKYYAKEENGLAYSQTKVTFKDEALLSVEYRLVYETKEQAEEYFEALLTMTVEYPHYDWQINDKEITGREFDLSAWDGMSFDEMKALFAEQNWNFE